MHSLVVYIINKIEHLQREEDVNLRRHANRNHQFFYEIHYTQLHLIYILITYKCDVIYLEVIKYMAFE